MPTSFTSFIEKTIQNYSFLDESLDAAAFLKNVESFRPFSAGLSELLFRSGYTGKDAVDEKTNYLYLKLHELGENVEKKTVKSWFSGEHRPKVEPASRPRMYKICFALDVSANDVVWFFHHVYFDRCYNCHRIEEAIYFYCFKHQLSYEEAQNMIWTIQTTSENILIAKDMPVQKDMSVSKKVPAMEYSPTLKEAYSSEEFFEKNVTRYIHDCIEEFETKEEFMAFLLENKSQFAAWNQTAFQVIEELLSKITGRKSVSSKEIDRIKRFLKRKSQKSSDTMFYCQDLDPDLLKNCGLLLREIYFDANRNFISPSDTISSILEQIGNKNVFSVQFLLENILLTSSGLPQKAELPTIIKLNFPCKKTLSDIIGTYKKNQDKLEIYKISDSQSYDAIRKVIILLQFYSFWTEVKLQIRDIYKYKKEVQFQIYLDETNFLLNECGYEDLYPGNPYEWLFLVCSSTEEPLAFFRSCMNDLSEISSS